MRFATKFLVRGRELKKMKTKTALKSSATYSLLALGFCLSSAVTQASTTLNAVNSGNYYNNNGVVSNDGAASNIGIWGDTKRDWLGFDLTGITGTITGATLKVNSSASNASGQTINWYDVTTPYASLGSVSSTAIFNDLGSGVLFGQGTHTAGTINSYVLNPAAIAALNAAEGSKWAIGGQENSGGYAFAYLSGISSPNNPIQLCLDFQPANTLTFNDSVNNVPETGSSLAMAALGFCAVVGLRHIATRRRQQLVRA
jgi:hypothetical protein